MNDSMTVGYPITSSTVLRGTNAEYRENERLTESADSNLKLQLICMFVSVCFSVLKPII